MKTSMGQRKRGVGHFGGNNLTACMSRYLSISTGILVVLYGRVCLSVRDTVLRRSTERRIELVLGKRYITSTL